MPNGEDRNWVRLCGAIDGFRSEYKTFPTQIRLSGGIYENIKHILSKDGLSKLKDKLTIIIDNSSTYICAEDNSGKSYDYVKKGFPKNPPDIKAAKWLNIDFNDLEV